MKEGQKVTWRHRWLTQQGIGTPVTLIEFKSYCMTPNRYPNLKMFQGVTYTCEIWLCEMPSGIKRELKFRVLADEEFEFKPNEEVGWDYNKTPMKDNIPNLINDEPEEIKVGIVLRRGRTDMNKGLGRFTKHQDILDNNLRTIIKRSKDSLVVKAARLRLAFRERPSNYTIRMWTRFRVRNSEIVDKLSLMMSIMKFKQNE